MTDFLAKMRDNSRLQAKIAGRNPDEVDGSDIMSTHPRTKARVQQAMQLAGATAGKGTIDRDGYLRRIDRMIYGDSPNHGLVRGRALIHPVQQYRFQVPEGFRLKSLPDAAIAVSPAKMLIQFDRAEEPYGGGMTGYIAEEWGSELTVEELKSVSVNGLAAATAKTVLDSGNGRLYLRLAAIRFDAKRIYRFIAVAPRDSAARLSPAMRETLFSFRRIGRAEAAAAKPWRLRVVPVRRGDTVYGISKRSPFESLKKERFLVMNGFDAGRPLRVGETVKLVAEE